MKANATCQHYLLTTKAGQILHAALGIRAFPLGFSFARGILNLSGTKFGDHFPRV